MPEPRRYGTTAAGHACRSFGTRLASTTASAPSDPVAGSSVTASYPSGPAQAPTATFAWHPGAPLPTYAAVVVPQQPAPVRGSVRVPWGHGGCGGSGGPPATAELYGQPYGGAPLRPVDVNQRPSIANQQGPATGVAGMQGSTGQGYEDGLRLRGYALHPGHLLAATGTAAGTKGDGVAAASGACGSGAAAGAAVRGYHNARVGGAGVDPRAASPHAFRPLPARAGSPLGPTAKSRNCPQSEDGGGVAGAEGPSGGLRSRGAGGGAGGGGQPPAARGAAGASAFGTCSGGGPPEATGLAAPEAPACDTGEGVAMRADLRASAICLRRHVVAALWPGVVEQMRVNQPKQILLHTGYTPDAARPSDSGAQQQEQGDELCVYYVKLMLYRRSDWRLTAVKAALRALGVVNKEAVGLRRLPCGRVLLERWQGQDQEEEEEDDMQRADSQDNQMPSDEADEGIGGEYVSAPKRPRLQRLALGGSHIRTGLWAQGQQAAQASVMGPQQGTATERAPAGPTAAAAAAAGTQLCYKVRHLRNELRPQVVVVHAFWPQLAARLKRLQGAANSIQVTLHTGGGAPPRVPGQRGLQHAVQLSYVGAAKVFRLSYTGGVLAALGLRDEGVLQLRRTPDGRVWAERAGAAAVTPAHQQPAPALAASRSAAAAAPATNVDAPSAASQQPARGSAVASALAAVARATGTAAAVPTARTTALQQLNPARAAASAAAVAAAPATDTTGIGDGTPVASSSAYSPFASPAPSPDVPHPLPAGPSTTTTSTAIMCVSGGYLHLDRPTVAALWPECVDMPVSTQQLVRMRAVVEPGGGSHTAAAAAASLNVGPGRSVTHYGTQLARLGPAVWRVERPQSLLREQRLGEGDWVELVPLEGGVVGLRRAGADAEAAGQRGGRAAVAAAWEEAGRLRGTGGWAREAGGSKGEAMGR